MRHEVLFPRGATIFHMEGRCTIGTDWALQLPFSDLLLLSSVHEHKGGHMAATFHFFCSGNCSWEEIGPQAF